MSNLYIKTIDTYKISLDFDEIGSNLKQNMTEVLQDQIGDKCSKHGYIKSDSINILNHSSGLLNGSNVVFYVTIEFDSCYPTEGLRLECNILNITKAGIRAGIENEPHVIIFIPRDHNFANSDFINMKENDTIIVDIIGTKYELNDENIYIIGEFVSAVNERKKMILKEDNLVQKTAPSDFKEPRTQSSLAAV